MVNKALLGIRNIVLGICAQALVISRITNRLASVLLGELVTHSRALPRISAHSRPLRARFTWNKRARAGEAALARWLHVR